MKAINDNLTAYLGGGAKIEKRWIELHRPSDEKPRKQKSGDEIAKDIMEKAGLRFNGKDDE